jgi:peptidoglycan/LPS O-acetylase OafA/YrhL
MLAFWVMLFHLLPVPVIGGFAVFSFFILSGFLMTMIMHDSYGYSKGGLNRYGLNRFLRLYPMYWAVCLVSVLLIFLIGSEYSSQYKNTLFFPTDLVSVLANVSMIFPSFFPTDISPRLSPPTWALTVEIFFYVLIGLGISKTYRRTVIWLIVSIVYFAITYLFELGGGYRYSFIFAASLPFSLGALIYFIKEPFFAYLKQMKLSNPWAILAVYIVVALFFTMNNYYRPFSFSGTLGEFGIYINMLLSLIVVVVLFYRGKELCSQKVDKSIGDYSYPVYLIHWQCGLLASYLLYQEPNRDFTLEGLTTFALATLFVVIASYLLITIIDRSISKLRNKIRENK